MLALLATVGVGAVSALVPVVNLEAYLGGLALLGAHPSWWQVAAISAAAALGQMAGKTLFFLAGRGVLTLPDRLRRETADAGQQTGAAVAVAGSGSGEPTATATATATLAPPSQRSRVRARLAAWQSQLERRPWLAAGLLLVSASTGVPPFAVLSVTAGAAGVGLPTFLVTGFLGRWARFAVILGLVSLTP